MHFHNNYHFYPCPDDPKRVHDVSRADFDNGEPEAATHDRYVTGTHSGRIQCRVTSESPIFVGGLRTSGAPAHASHFQRDGNPAIPASSLRGLISSLGEAASNSSLRVLLDEDYSFRRVVDPKFKETLSAIGMVRRMGDSFTLYPLALPTLTCNLDGFATLPPEYQPLFPLPLLRVYVGKKHEISDRLFPFRTNNNWENLDWHFMNLQSRAWLPGFRLADDEYQHRKPASRQFLLAQLPIDGNFTPRRRVENPEAAKGKTSGVLRVLGCWGNRSDTMPSTKKHELFLPFPPPKGWPKVPIPQSVVDQFHSLCDERSDASFDRFQRDRKKNPLFPFEPMDTRTERYKVAEGDKEAARIAARIRIQHGDLVYFKPNANGTQIDEISFSSIWRGKVKGTTYSFFPQAVLPFRGNPDNKVEDKPNLTPGDLLFGFVEDLGEKPETRATPRQGLALASRVRLSDATLDLGASGIAPIRLPAVILKVQDSPKLPCPAFYFKPRTIPLGGYIAKRDLNPGNHVAQGYKAYLHHRTVELTNAPWKTGSPGDNLEQKAEIDPVRAGAVFTFDVEFKNLSPYELGLLLYVLRPTSEFRHKIGLGKALGLGTIRMDIERVQLVNRPTRYTAEGYFLPRYGAEYDAAEADKLRQDFRKEMNADLRAAIEMIGNPACLLQPVKPPLVAGQPEEKETFRFFVINDGSGRQFLAPIRAAKPLPSLSQPQP